jgi:hypothetical protein
MRMSQEVGRRSLARHWGSTRSGTACVTSILLTACALAGQSLSPRIQGVAPGTYRIQICQGPCDTQDPETLVAVGHLVIENASYTTADLPVAARTYFEDWTALLLGAAAKDRPNSCFVISRSREAANSYAGLEKVGLTLVEAHRGDSIRVALYQSPDASYYAVLLPAGQELRGRGRSSGVADAAGRFSQDSVVARRIGPPDRGLCIRAAEAEATALEARRHPPRP